MEDVSAFIGPGGMDRELARSALIEVLDLGLDFKYRDRFLEHPSGRTNVESLAHESIPAHGDALDRVLDELRSSYLPYLPNMSSPNFAGFPDSGNNIGAVGGAILSELINVNMINSTISAAGATEMELSVIGWLRELLGYVRADSPLTEAYECGGIPTQGGTAANFAAMLLALSRASPGRRTKGQGSNDVRVLIPRSIGHYTVAASAAWAGLGTDAVLEAPIDGYRYDLVQLQEILSDLRSNGVELAMAVAYAGDSRTMTIERLGEFAELVRRYYPDVWLHCDGCHGTSLLFSGQLRRRLEGIDLYDSVALDPHKVLAVPFTSSYLLVRNPADLRTIATESELILTQARSMGQITPVSGTRAFQSLRVWMLLKTLGVEGVGRMVEQRLENAGKFAALIDSTPGFIRLNDVELNSVAFTLIPEGATTPLSSTEAAASDALTKRVYRRMMDDGEYYLHSFAIPDSLGKLGIPEGQVHTVLRYMSGNALMNDQVQLDIIKYVKGLSR